MSANATIMVWYSCTDPGVSKMQDQTSLTLRWHSIVWGDSDMPTTVLEHNRGHRIGDAIISLHSPWIIQDARPIIVDAVLMLIVQMW